MQLSSARARSIAKPEDRPQYDATADDDEGERSGEAEGGAEALAAWRRRDFPEDENEQDRGQQDARVFGRYQQPGGDGDDDEAPPSGLLYVAVKSVDGGKEEAGHAHVRGDDCGVGQEIGV